MDFFLAIAGGALVVISMGLNSALSLRIGVFRAAAVNYLAGLVGACLLVLAVGIGSNLAFAAVPWWAWGGGLLGVGIVAASNIVLPRIPVITATGLLLLGQLGTGLVLDALRQGSIAPLKVAGAILVLTGVLLTQREPRPVVPSPEAVEETTKAKA